MTFFLMTASSYAKSPSLGEPSFLMSLLLFSSFLFPVVTLVHEITAPHLDHPSRTSVALCSKLPSFAHLLSAYSLLTTTSFPKSYQSNFSNLTSQTTLVFLPLTPPPCALVPATIFILSQAPSCLLFLLPRLKMSAPGPILSPHSPHLPGPVHSHTLITLNSYLSPDCSLQLPTHFSPQWDVSIWMSQWFLTFRILSWILPLLLCSPGQERTPYHEPNHSYHPLPPATN